MSYVHPINNFSSNFYYNQQEFGESGQSKTPGQTSSYPFQATDNTATPHAQDQNLREHSTHLLRVQTTFIENTNSSHMPDYDSIYNMPPSAHFEYFNKDEFGDNGQYSKSDQVYSSVFNATKNTNTQPSQEPVSADLPTHEPDVRSATTGNTSSGNMIEKEKQTEQVPTISRTPFTADDVRGLQTQANTSQRFKSDHQNPVAVKIGKMIKEARLTKGWSQQELANKISSTVKSVENWENGVFRPQTRYLRRLSDVFKLTLELHAYTKRSDNTSSRVLNPVSTHTDITQQNRTPSSSAHPSNANTVHNANTTHTPPPVDMEDYARFYGYPTTQRSNEPAKNSLTDAKETPKLTVINLMQTQQYNKVSTEPLPIFSENIIKLRLSERWDQEFLGHKLKVDILTIKNWEDGSCFPTRDELISLARLFNVPEESLFIKLT